MTQNIQEFLSMMAEAQKAIEERPSLVAEINNLRYGKDKAEEHSQNLELTIRDLRNQLAAAAETTRRLEAERDDTGFRLLESEDRREASLRALKEARATINDVLGVVETAAHPEPVAAQPEPAAPMAPQAPSEAAPATAPAVSEASAKVYSAKVYNEPIPPTLPVSTSGPTGSVGALPNSETGAALASEPVPTSSPPSSSMAEHPERSVEGHFHDFDKPQEAQQANTAQPYAGKQYWEVPAHVTYADFKAGGGIGPDVETKGDAA